MTGTTGTLVHDPLLHDGHVVRLHPPPLEPVTCLLHGTPLTWGHGGVKGLVTATAPAGGLGVRRQGAVEDHRDGAGLASPPTPKARRRLRGCCRARLVTEKHRQPILPWEHAAAEHPAFHLAKPQRGPSRALPV